MSPCQPRDMGGVEIDGENQHPGDDIKRRNIERRNSGPWFQKLRKRSGGEENMRLKAGPRGTTIFPRCRTSKTSSAGGQTCQKISGNMGPWHFLTDQCQLRFNKVFGSSRPREVREPNQPSLDSRGAFASALSTAVPGASFHRFARGVEHGVPRPYRVHFSPTAGWIKRLHKCLADSARPRQWSVRADSD